MNFNDKTTLLAKKGQYGRLVGRNDLLLLRATYALLHGSRHPVCNSFDSFDLLLRLAGLNAGLLLII